MREKRLILAIAVAALSTAACSTMPASGESASSNTTASVVQDKAGKLYKAPVLKQNESAVVFLRIDSIKDPQTSVNISFNNNFQSSLQAGERSTLKTCAGSHAVGGEITGSKTNNLELNSRAIRVEPNNIQFVAVSVDPETKKVVLNPIKEKTALKYIPSTQEQVGLKSRVAKEPCADTSKKPKVKGVSSSKPVVQKTFSLSSDFLFDPDNFQLKPSALEEVDRLSYRIKNNYLSVSSIVVISHTDYLGSTKRNQELTQKRAESVKSELVAHGFNRRDIRAVGVGSSDPLSNGCKGMSAERTRSCLALDRRVEVEVSGRLR